jgi:hypothetical protein
MKTKLRLGAIGAFAMGAALAFPQGQPIQVTVNGNQVNFSGQGPIMRGDRVMVPLRGVLEQMGARVDWDPASQTVTARRDKTRVRLRIGEVTAAVDGSPVTLDVPALIIDGSTMVPLRFVSEALGGDVHWDAADEMVQINTAGEDYKIPHRDHDERPQPQPAPPVVVVQPPAPARPQEIQTRIIFPAGSVLSVNLNADLNSQRNRRGDGFTTTIQNGSEGLPPGTQIDGYLAGARPMNGNDPGMLELRFDHMVLPNGARYTISGTLIGLDDGNVVHRNGRLVARDGAPNRAAFTGYGAGAGLVVGLADRHPIEDTAIGALIGNAIGAAQRRNVHNVHLAAGTTFGVRLNSELVVHGRDDR